MPLSDERLRERQRREGLGLAPVAQEAHDELGLDRRAELQRERCQVVFSTPIIPY